jgi:IQ domain-containing protein G
VLELAGAIRIQAWWRGVMVRRQLGPFKPKKKSAKSKKKEKK